MAKEILAIPEHHLADVIRVIRRGLEIEEVDDIVHLQLTKWCKKKEKYWKELQEE